MAQTQVPDTCPVCGEKVKEGEACVFTAPVTTTGRGYRNFSHDSPGKEVKEGHLRVLILGGKKNKYLIHLECWDRRVSWR